MWIASSRTRWMDWWWSIFVRPTRRCWNVTWGGRALRDSGDCIQPDTSRRLKTLLAERTSGAEARLVLNDVTARVNSCPSQKRLGPAVASLRIQLSSDLARFLRYCLGRWLRWFLHSWPQCEPVGTHALPLLNEHPVRFEEGANAITLPSGYFLENWSEHCECAGAEHGALGNLRDIA